MSSDGGEGLQLGLLDTPEPLPGHPAKYHDALIDEFVGIVRDYQPSYVLDPFGGTGKIFLVADITGVECEAVEIEPKWAAYEPRTTVGNALDLPWPDDTFDAVITSPTYGNRMADHHNARDNSRRNTYRHIYGETLHEDNSGTLQWGPKYRDFHERAWAESRRVLRPGGIFVLNCKDHYRDKRIQYVTDWHVSVLGCLGFSILEQRKITLPGNRQGANADLRLDYEYVVVMRLAGEGAYEQKIPHRDE